MQQQTFRAMIVEESAPGEFVRRIRSRSIADLPAGDLLVFNDTKVIPAELDGHHLTLANGGSELIYTYDTQGPRTGITGLLTDLARAGIRFKDLDTSQSSLEDIFVDLVRQQ